MPAGKLVHAIARQLRHPQASEGPRLAGPPSALDLPLHPDLRSWLNAVEGFFAKLTKRRLKRGVFRSIVELQAAINRFLAETNADPKPFRWTADPDKIIAAVKRGHQVLEFYPLSCSPFQAAGANIPCLSVKLFSAAATGQGRRHDHETTVDHALMRGLVTAGPVMRRGASSV